MIVDEAEFSLPTGDGHVIRGGTWSASATPTAQVLVAHGRSEHARRTADEHAYRDVRRSLPLITGDRDPVNHFSAWFDRVSAQARASAGGVPECS